MHRLLPLLLRVMLSVALVFNGTAYAIGGPQVQMHPAAASDMHAGKDCHHHGGMGLQDPHAGHQAGAHPSSGCCKAGTCACASQPTVPAAATLELPEIAFDRIDATPLVTGHLPPLLAGLIRPPIA